MLLNYGKILYATDLSINAAQAFRHAIGFARLSGAKIHVLHVMPDVDASVLNYISTAMGEERLVNLELAHKDEIKEQIRQRLQQFAKDELTDHPEELDRIVDIEVHHGNPVGCILETADRLDSDLIVVGSHGKGKLKYACLGSVAEKLLHKSQKPVLVVPLNV
jgi:nucleotide-binding universal stress UspA family protein